MNSKALPLLFMIVAVPFAAACSKPSPTTTNPTRTATPKTQTESPSALPNEAFRAEITLVSPPTKLRVGEKVVVQVKIKNNSQVQWWSRGGPTNTRSDNKFYVAAGDRWLKADGTLVTNMDGRYGIGKDLKPGEETEVPLQITAPKDAGEYTLEVDLVQEAVAWFSEKGSPTAKTKVMVVR